MTQIESIVEPDCITDDIGWDIDDDCMYSSANSIKSDQFICQYHELGYVRMLCAVNDMIASQLLKMSFVGYQYR